METHARPPWRLLLLAAGLGAAILLPFVVFGASLERWFEGFAAAGAGHPAATAAVLGGLLAGDIVLPTPSSLVSTACGRCLGFARGTLVSFGGMTVSAVLGYLLGASVAGFAERRLTARDLRTLRRLHGRWGVWMLAAVRPVPVLAANLAVSAVYAVIGALARGTGSTLAAFAGAALLSGLVMLGFRRGLRTDA